MDCQSLFNLSVGPLAGNLTRALPEKAQEELKRLIPMVRLGTPDDVAKAVLFLVTSGSDYMTGQVLQVNGGLYM